MTNADTMEMGRRHLLGDAQCKATKKDTAEAERGNGLAAVETDVGVEEQRWNSLVEVVARG